MSKGVSCEKACLVKFINGILIFQMYTEKFKHILFCKAFPERVEENVLIIPLWFTCINKYY